MHTPTRAKPKIGYLGVRVQGRPHGEVAEDEKLISPPVQERAAGLLAAALLPACDPGTVHLRLPPSSLFARPIH